MTVDDTERVQIWFSWSSSSLTDIRACISDVKVLVVQNKCQWNDDRMGLFVIGSAPGIDHPSNWSSFFIMCGSRWHPSFQHIPWIEGTGEPALWSSLYGDRQISFIQHYLSFEATKTPFILYPLGLVIVMLSWLAFLRFLIKFRVSSCSACTISKAPKSAHTTP